MRKPVFLQMQVFYVGRGPKNVLIRLELMRKLIFDRFKCKNKAHILMVSLTYHFFLQLSLFGVDQHFT